MRSPSPIALRSAADAVRGRPVNERLETLGDAWLNYYAGFVVFQVSRRRWFLPAAGFAARSLIQCVVSIVRGTLSMELVDH